MKKKLFSTGSFFVFLIVLLLANACNSSNDDKITHQLAELDTLVYKQPKCVLDSLEKLKTDAKSGYNQAYWGLIKTMAGERTGVTFHSDSLITFVVSQFALRPDYKPLNYTRALLYQGIVRFQNGITDSRSYQPIKDALNRLDDKSSTDKRIRQIAYYYLGLIQYFNNNVELSEEYFLLSEISAPSLNDSILLFKIYRDNYWNRMKALDYKAAKSYLDTMRSYSANSEYEIHDIKNAQSAFFFSQNRFHDALKLDYELLSIDKKNDDRVSLLADYYRISDNHKSLNNLDSALVYGEKATKLITDTTFYLNYYYYLNIAEIAARLGNWQKSSTSYAQVYRLLNMAITQKLNTQIFELEKKYDISKAENKELSLKNSILWLQFVLVILCLALLIWFLISRQRSRLQKETEKSILQENKILEQEKLLAEEKEKQMLLDKKLTERKLIEKQFVIPIYRQISQRNLDIKNFLLDLQSNGYILKNQQMHQKIADEYKNFIQTTKITDTQFLSDELFADLTGIAIDESKLFNESEKMMMAFISTGADNQQMATLLNSSVESVRVRKSKLKKKMQENNVKIPEALIEES